MDTKKWVTALFFIITFLGLSGISYGQTNGFSCQDVTEIPVSECEALIAYYNSTNGEAWSFYPPPPGSEWVTNNQPCSWYGVDYILGHVTGLDLSPTFMEGTIPPELGNLPYLVNLSLHSPDLYGPLPPELGNLTSLQTLTLAHNNLSGLIPAQLGNLTLLQTLNLSFNQLNGPLPATLGQLTNLRQLALTDNQLTGPIPPEIGNLTSLEGISLHHNKIHGNMPSTLGNLSNLEIMDISHNQLSGTIPPELGNLNNLTDLRLNHNSLIGPIPLELGMLDNLIMLMLDHNQLTGLLPPSLGNLSNLSSLYLNDNQLTGPLPSEWGNLINLDALQIQNNPLLAGPLADSFLMIDLLTFDFGNTSVCVPDEPAFIAWLSTIPTLNDSGILCTPAVSISPSGGTLVSQDGHTTIAFPADAFVNTTTLTYTQFINLPTGNLAGVNRFFSLEATQNGTVITHTLTPMTITVTYANEFPVISGTVKLYRMENNGWTDEGINHISDTDNHLVSEAEYLTWYAVLGDTNHIFLPLILRSYDQE
ncbi:MAG: hypothetical protein R6X32_06560 [Chloroflexota bacterium]